MKIRNGFVSNSSTTSFCIYGAWVNGPSCPNEDDEDFDAYEEMEEICGDLGLSCHSMEGMSGYAVGLPPWCMEPNETRAEFEARVAKLLQNKFEVDDVECEWIEEAYYS